MLAVSWMMLRAAQIREESRGVHLRTDFPQVDEARWRRHIGFRRQDGGKIDERTSPPDSD